MRRLIFSLAIILMEALYGQSGYCWAQDVKVLSLAEKIARTIRPNEKHQYVLQLSSERYVSGYVDQKGANLNVVVFGPDGKVVLFQDQQRNVDTVEPFGFSTDEPGKYTVQLTALPGQAIVIDRDKNSFIWDGERRVPYETANQKGAYSIFLTEVEKGKTLPSRVDEVFRFYDKDDYPGAAIAIVRDGKVIYKKGYGMANLEYDIPVTPTSVFHIASVSKQFAGFALATLHHNGEISLDDDIHDYIPELHIKEKITVRQMLNHTSGLRDQWVLLALAGWRMDDVITQDQLLKMIYKQEGLNFKPGEKYSYSNSNYTLAAEVVRRVSGQTLREWTTENIFKPLGMHNTFFYDDHEEIVRNRAYSYDDRSGEIKKSNLNFANSGATSLFTTVEDFSKWLINFGQLKVGNRTILDILTTPGVLNNGEETNYSLGLGLGEYKGFNVIDHSGVDAGYRSFMMYFPEEKLGIIVLSNIASCNTVQLAKKVADICLDLNSNPAVLKTKPSKEKFPYDDLVKIDKHKLNEYIGNYYSRELSTRYHLFLSNDRLMVRHKRLEDIEFLPTGDDFFKGTYWIFDHVKFIRNREGEVQGFRVSNGGVNKLLFEKL